MMSRPPVTVADLVALQTRPKFLGAGARETHMADAALDIRAAIDASERDAHALTAFSMYAANTAPAQVELADVRSVEFLRRQRRRESERRDDREFDHGHSIGARNSSAFGAGRGGATATVLGTATFAPPAIATICGIVALGTVTCDARTTMLLAPRIG